MATSISDWSTTASANTDLNGITLDGASMTAGQVDDAFREIMAETAAYTRRGSDLPSASTLNLDSVDNMYLDITGTITVTAVTLTATHARRARATGAFTLTASSSLIVNGSTSTNYTTTAGDLLFFEGYAAGVVRVWAFSGGTSSSASAADVWAGTSTTKFPTPSSLLAATAEVALTDGATVTVDFAAGINFKLDTIGGNRTLAASNVSSALNRSGYIRVKQDGTGSRTLDMSGSPWVNAGGTNITLSTAAAATDVIGYTILSATQVLLTAQKAVA
jgi:hypothetical protein